MTPRRTAQLMSAVLTGSGLLHLVRPRSYEWLVPPELGPARPWVLASGVVEVVAGTLLAAPATRRAGGYLAAGLLVALVPAHLHTFRVVEGRAMTAAAAVRLPLQVPMIRAALRVARDG